MKEISIDEDAALEVKMSSSCMNDDDVIRASLQSSITSCRDWADLPMDLLHMIFSHVSLDNRVLFRLACRTWKSATLLVNSHLLLVQQHQPYPWLMYPSENPSEFKFLHPISNESYAMMIPELAGAKFRHCKYGWLLLSRGEHSLFFYNPVTGLTVTLPDTTCLTHGYLDCSRDDCSMDDLNDYFSAAFCFTAPPVSHDCQVLCIQSFEDQVTIYTCHHGDNYWVINHFDCEFPFKAASCSPIYCDGEYYNLNSNNMLGVLATEDEDGDATVTLFKECLWDVYPNTVIPYDPMVGTHYFAECDGELISVYAYLHGLTPIIRVHKLNWTEMNWVEVESMGNKTMFIGYTGCLLVPAKLKGTEDRIYFSKFRKEKNNNKPGNHSVFYNLRTRKYQSSGGSINSRDPRFDIETVNQYVWIEPTFDNQGAEIDNKSLIWFEDPSTQTDG